MKKRTIFLTGLLCAMALLIALAVGCVPDDGDEQDAVDCSETILRAVPIDPAAAGPWPVGSKTVEAAGLVTEVWYPAVPGSEAGQQKDWIDTRQYMPDSDPDPADPKFQVNAYADLPLDAAYGPYPVIVYVHGTGSFRQASHALFTHWASRGFVVLCADNPGINLGDLMEGGLGSLLSADQAGDTRALLDAVRAQSGELSFLEGAVATDRIGLSGHSAGGMAVSGLGDESGVRVIISMASGGVDEGSSVESAMIMGGMEDNAATESTVRSAYEGTAMKKRLVLIPDAGHNVFINVCPIVEETDMDLGSLTAIANDGCGPEYMDPDESVKIVQFAATGAFEEVLMCSETAADELDTIETRYPGVAYEYDASGSSSGHSSFFGWR